MPRAPWIALALILATPAATRAEESHYVLIWGSQSHPKRAKTCHTWATFVRAIGQGTDPNNYTLEAHTISWLPATLNVRVLALKPEPGVNLDVHQTLNYVLANRERVKLWGPFLIGARTWNESLRVREALLSGQVQYRAISTTYDLTIADCIHAVAATDPVFGRDHYPLIRVGLPASRYIARQVVQRSPAVGLRQELYDNSWLIPRLGLDGYPFEVIPPQQVPSRSCVLCLKPD